MENKENNTKTLLERIKDIRKNNQAENYKVTSIKTNRIAELRKIEGIKSRDKMAERMKNVISVSMIKQLEENTKPLTLDVALYFVEYFNVSLDWLFGLSDNVNGDEADNIEKVLNSIYNIKTKTVQFTDDNGFGHEENLLNLSINKKLYDFLLNTKEVAKMKFEKRITDETYNNIIKDFKQEYNKSVNDKNIEINDYVLVPSNLLYIRQSYTE